MGWDVTYTIRLLERIEEYHPRWVEEPVPPDRFNDFAPIRRSTRVPIATGEHEYTRWGFLQLLQAEAIDVHPGRPRLVRRHQRAGQDLHPRLGVRQAGGARTATRSTPRCTSSPRQPPATCPMAEFLLRSQPAAQHFHRRPVRPEGGSIALPQAPGLGLEIDDAKVEARREL